ncbi:hypothetical protein K503DRAFT_693060 [Rhizopogon vinicolor AM-OR11-026]|uniref:N-acetyltransferase domain-containing protein n=1 Tax=Rhizopogon vinicolor AM-OR11-026 TaxID=1314800 RepID=A0A1B7MYC4_9AGAM|nr:hypothetical protein K503DRAFT_693060 [Rhizopogon vinicolor AM-OR11-026]
MITGAILRGQKVILVPYEAEHVQQYHTWMSDPVLRQLTASDPLTLDEEYDMQKKWQDDPDKLTFIILARGNDEDLSANRMAGDINLFLKGRPEDDDFEAEVEIMIAELAYRRKGFALEALRLMLTYVTQAVPPFSSCTTLPLHTPPPPPPLPVHPSRLVVRISQSNQPSIKLFLQLGFAVVRVVEVFDEVEMRMIEGDN